MLFRHPPVFGYSTSLQGSHPTRPTIAAGELGRSIPYRRDWRTSKALLVVAHRGYSLPVAILPERRAMCFFLQRGEAMRLLLPRGAAMRFLHLAAASTNRSHRLRQVTESQCGHPSLARRLRQVPESQCDLIGSVLDGGI